MANRLQIIGYMAQYVMDHCGKLSNEFAQHRLDPEREEFVNSAYITRFMRIDSFLPSKHSRSHELALARRRMKINRIGAPAHEKVCTKMDRADGNVKYKKTKLARRFVYGY